jgi:GDPmannose 4,6-dehydratase
MAKKKIALITGVAGQDGSYLSKLLLEKGYKVYGATRRSGSGSLWRHKALGILGEIEVIDFEMLEQASIYRSIEKIKPDEIYNLAAQSFVKTSFEEPIYTSKVDGIAVVYLLEAIRTIKPDIKFYQASTSEIFGKVQEVPQKETTPFYPRSPYGVAKLYAHWITKNYRESYNLYACSGILFNHESPLRGVEFVTQKIVLGLNAISKGKQDILEIGNMDAMRDWGFAGDYVRGMYLMLQQKKADDYVLATGKTHTVRNFIEKVAKLLDFEIQWKGKDDKEYGIDKKTNKTIIKVNPKFYRPAEVELLIGDASKARKELGWKPEITFDKLIEMMVKHNIYKFNQ